MCDLTPHSCRPYSDHRTVCCVRQLTIFSSDKGFELVDFYTTSAAKELKKSFKGHFIGLLKHCGRSAYCVLTLNDFPLSSPEAPRIIQMRETSTSEGGNYYHRILLADP